MDDGLAATAKAGDFRQIGARTGILAENSCFILRAPRDREFARHPRGAGDGEPRYPNADKREG